MSMCLQLISKPYAKISQFNQCVSCGQHQKPMPNIQNTKIIVYIHMQMTLLLCLHLLKVYNTYYSYMRHINELVNEHKYLRMQMFCSYSDDVGTCMPDVIC